jgi:hypothetical protein
MKTMEAVVLCGKPGRCCPIFKKEGRKYSISDKGQEVILTKDQLKMLCKEICVITKECRCKCGGD